MTDQRKRNALWIAFGALAIAPVLLFAMGLSAEPSTTDRRVTTATATTERAPTRVVLPERAESDDATPVVAPGSDRDDGGASAPVIGEWLVGSKIVGRTAPVAVATTGPPASPTTTSSRPTPSTTAPATPTPSTTAPTTPPPATTGPPTTPPATTLPPTTLPPTTLPPTTLPPTTQAPTTVPPTTLPPTTLPPTTLPPTTLPPITVPPAPTACPTVLTSTPWGRTYTNGASSDGGSCTYSRRFPRGYGRCTLVLQPSTAVTVQVDLSAWSC